MTSSRQNSKKTKRLIDKYLKANKVNLNNNQTSNNKLINQINKIF